MNRSTTTAPVTLSISYFTGSASIGISTTTLNSFGGSRPAVTACRLMEMPALASSDACAVHEVLELEPERVPDRHVPVRHHQPGEIRARRDPPMRPADPTPLHLAGHAVEFSGARGQ